jgi:predicted GNAT family acetyltransferase
MGNIELKLNGTGRGAFVLEKEGKVQAEMGIGIQNENLTVYHTEVAGSLKGQGVGSQLLSAMVDYSRAHQLKVIALCPYVLAQFKRHPDQYADIWNKNWHK